MSRRLTNDDRKSIVREAISRTFDKEEKKLLAEKVALTTQLYNSAMPRALQRRLKSLGEKWINTTLEPSFSLRNGYTFYGARSPKEKKFFLPLAYSERRFVVKDEALTDAAVNLMNRCEELKKRVRQSELDLTAMLGNISTTKQLVSVWPQGKKFYARLLQVTESKTCLPAVLLEKVNATFNLE